METTLVTIDLRMDTDENKLFSSRWIIGVLPNIAQIYGDFKKIYLFNKVKNINFLYISKN